MVLFGGGTGFLANHEGKMAQKYRLRGQIKSTIMKQHAFPSVAAATKKNWSELIVSDADSEVIWRKFEPQLLRGLRVAV